MKPLTLRSGRASRLPRGFGRRCVVWLAILTIVGCAMPIPMIGPPSFDGFLQEFQTRVDEGADGSLEDFDPGVLTAGASDPGVVATSTASQQVSLSIESDADSILTHCEHTLTAGTSLTTCIGTVRGQFVPAESGLASFFIHASLNPSSLDLPLELDDALSADVTIDCGIDSGMATVENPRVGFGPGNRAWLSLDAEAGTPCEVTIALVATATTTASPEAASLTQTLSVTTNGGALPACTRSDQCPAESPVCDANGECGTGDEGQVGEVAAVHCVTPYATQFGCSWGVSGSICRGDFECETDSGYSCLAGVCTGSVACTSDLDCPVEAGFCSDQGTCSPYGAQGDGCVTGGFCRQGLICLSNRCTVVLGVGQDCTQPFTTCDGPFACFPSTGTCEVPLGLGSVCSDNVECADFPLDNSCNQAIGGGTCSVRQPSGGPCAANIDCEFGSCNTVAGVCL